MWIRRRNFYFFFYKDLGCRFDNFFAFPLLQTCTHIVLWGSSQFPMLSVETVCASTFSLEKYGPVSMCEWPRLLLREVKTWVDGKSFIIYESIKQDLKRRLIYEYRCDERLKTKTEESTRLTDTGLVVELEHLKIKTRFIDEKFTSVRGECEI